MDNLVLRPGVTERDAVIYANEYAKRYDLPGIDRTTWSMQVRRMAEAENASWRSGGTRMFDVSFVREFAEYAAKRRLLQQLGKWSKQRPLDRDDMRALVNDGSMDGEVDHPLFAIALPTQ